MDLWGCDRMNRIYERGINVDTAWKCSLPYFFLADIFHNDSYVKKITLYGYLFGIFLGK
jgi:hypothetical protein